MVYQLLTMKRYSTGPLLRLATLATPAVLLAGGACSAPSARHLGAPSASPTRDAQSDAQRQPDAQATGTTTPGGSASAVVVPRPTKKLSVVEATRYMLALVNRDRATQGLAPVELDEGAPTQAGQAHAEDMARLGYLGHWGSDGSVPEQRHTEAGGADMVLENALCFTDEAKRRLDAKPLIDPVQIERAESLFFDEVPPNDGHRKNILKAGHTKVGIGVAQPISTPTEIAVPCFTQEFTDGYGTYAPLPRRAKVGTVIHVEGSMTGGARPSGVGVARVVRPAQIAASELNKRRSYPVPKPFQMYWGPGFVTPVPVKLDGPKLAVDVTLSDRAQPGLYEVSVWAKLGKSEEHTMVSLRTIVVE